FDRINYFSIILFLSLFVFQCYSFAQLTGTKTIPGDYATVEAAIADLNLQGVGSGGVTFNVAAGHSETFTSDTSGRFRATGTVSDPIVFQKSGAGSNPVITAGVGTGTLDGIVVITGGDYVTFDGIDVSENPANTNDNTRMEWGYALLKRNLSSPADGCQYVTIKNATITLDGTNTDTWGIYAKNHTVASTTSSTLSDSLDVLRYCKFYSNTITYSYNGIQLYGSSSIYDENNEIGVDGGNSILNYGGGSTTARGIYTYYQSNLKVANNIVNGGNYSHTTLLYGISTYTANNADISIYGNTITLTQGNNLTYALTNSVGSSGVDNTVNIYNNTIQNCTNIATGSYSAWLIYNLASAYNVNIYGNTITNNSRSAGTGPVYCIKQSSSATNVNIFDNEIYNNAANGSIYGVELASGTNLYVYKNNIYNLRTTSTSTYLASGVMVSGSSSGPGNVNIYNNFISDLKAPNSSDDDAIRGINLTCTTSGSNIGVYYNTIFLNAASVGANFGSSGIYQTTSTLFARPTLDMRDNIIVNNSAPNGSGKTVVFRRSTSDATLNYYSTLSNNNCFYAGIPSASKVIFFDGTNSDQTLAEFKTRVAPRETNSITEDVPFINNTTAPYDLHVQTSVSTQTESGGTPITTPIAITSDYDGDVRNITTPDIGADEFNGISIDITPPSIIYTVFDPTTSTANRTLSNVDITDQSGVNVTPGTAPRIYYKRTSDNNTFVDNTSSTNGWKYTETSNISSPYEFLIDYSKLFGGTGVQMGDFIQYFVVAQDLAIPANIGINSGDFNSIPVSVDLTVAAFPITGSINSYYIITTLNGTVTVGS
ncbi:MAG: hypothetical protein OQK56_05080, partial [Ignavibacteriaceae bacterium]|nr:hypothetical protein [Ignavibacteriaceae bacterium]